MQSDAKYRAPRQCWSSRRSTWGAMFAVAKSALGTLDAYLVELTWRYVPAVDA